MCKMDLDIATPKQIQEAIVEKMPRVDLDAYKKYIDTEVRHDSTLDVSLKFVIDADCLRRNGKLRENS